MGEGGCDLLIRQWQVTDVTGTQLESPQVSTSMMMLTMMKALTDSVLCTVENTVA